MDADEGTRIRQLAQGTQIRQLAQSIRDDAKALRRRATHLDDTAYQLDAIAAALPRDGQ